MANAGRTDPFIVGLSECLDAQLDSHFLGFCERPEFCKKEVGICAGDHVVFYSDAVSEQENESGEFYGAEALKPLVRLGGVT
jgi:serine phosphatase RsbU (regulator of sigma subunit)